MSPKPLVARRGAKKARMFEIGKELYLDGGLDALENMFFALENKIREIGKDPKTPPKPLELHHSRVGLLM